MRKSQIGLLVLLILWCGSQAFGAASQPEDLGCYAVQGHCAPKRAHGKLIVGGRPFHNAIAAGWDSRGTELGQATWKQVLVSAAWVAEAKILSFDPGCKNYILFIKNIHGMPQELWCADANRIVLLWEMLDTRSGRYWLQPDGNLGIVLFNGLFFDSHTAPGNFLVNRVTEQYFHCAAEGPQNDQSVDVADFNRAIKPIDISTAELAAAAKAKLTEMQVVSSAVPDEAVIPQSWVAQAYEQGKLHGKQQASLFLLQGYWGGTSCANERDFNTCTAENRETIWLLRVGDMETAYMRWQNQKWDPLAGEWRSPVAGDIGTVTRLVPEGGSPILPVLPCQ